MKQKTTMNLEENIESIGREMPFSNEAEVSQVFKNLDNDETNNESGMSNIDFNARLTNSEASACIVVDELVALGVLPKSVRIARQKKRLSVSIGGKGREEKVTIASAHSKAGLQKKSGGFLSRLFSPRKGGDNIE